MGLDLIQRKPVWVHVPTLEVWREDSRSWVGIVPMGEYHKMIESENDVLLTLETLQEMDRSISIGMSNVFDRLRFTSVWKSDLICDLTDESRGCEWVPLYMSDSVLDSVKMQKADPLERKRYIENHLRMQVPTISLNVDWGEITKAHVGENLPPL